MKKLIRLRFCYFADEDKMIHTRDGGNFLSCCCCWGFTDCACILEERWIKMCREGRGHTTYIHYSVMRRAKTVEVDQGVSPPQAGRGRSVVFYLTCLAFFYMWCLRPSLLTSKQASGVSFVAGRCLRAVDLHALWPTATYCLSSFFFVQCPTSAQPLLSLRDLFAKFGYMFGVNYYYYLPVIFFFWLVGWGVGWLVRWLVACTGKRGGGVLFFLIFFAVICKMGIMLWHCLTWLPHITIIQRLL